MSDESKEWKRLAPGKTDANEAASKYAALTFNTDETDALNRKNVTKGLDKALVLARLAGKPVNDAPFMMTNFL